MGLMFCRAGLKLFRTSLRGLPCHLAPVDLTPTNVGDSYFGSLPIKAIKHSFVGVRTRNCPVWWDWLVWKNALNADF